MPHMPTKKIGDLPKDMTCMSPDHRPPIHMVYPDGLWEHTCSSCGHVTSFTVANPRC